MNTTQLPYLVEGILILAAMLFGILLARAGKPHGKVKLAIHLFLYLWFSVGFAFIAYSIFTIDVTNIVWVPIAIMGLMILIQLVSGIMILISRQVTKTLPMIHIISAILLFLSDISAFVITGNHS